MSEPVGMAQDIRIDPRPTHRLSPDLYMQFMEPLGATDGSVEAAWDHQAEDWRPDVVRATKQLAPPLIRFGGCLSSYYRWREAVGPRPRRKPMLNLLWGGTESNQVGTAEFVDFCRRVGARGFYCVNFESDGRRHWARPRRGGVRAAGPGEAADWVSYCNDPDHPLRRRHGHAEPFGLKLWQIGNETSYDIRGYDLATAARRTVAFAQAMRRRDPEIKLIGWGDRGWTRGMLDAAGEHLDYLAFHDMFDAGSGDKGSPLRDDRYRLDPDAAWAHLMAGADHHERRIRDVRDTAGPDIPLALTECHFTLPGRNRNEVLSTWAAGVANARLLNLHQRHGDRLEIATVADFCGTRWHVNALMIPVPRGDAYLTPVGRVMALYRRHTGSRAVTVERSPAGLDVVASRRGRRFFLHVVNTNRTRRVTAGVSVAGHTIASARSFEVAAPPEIEVAAHNADRIRPVTRTLEPAGRWSFPAASVSAVELRIADRPA